jgi:hypothetical protein
MSELFGKGEFDTKQREAIGKALNILLTAQILHDVAVLAGDGHRVVGVDGVRLVVVGELVST